MALTKTGFFAWAGGGKNGASVDMWLVSRFVSPPAENGPPPSGDPDGGPVITDDVFGGPGAFAIDLPLVDDYYVRAVYNGVAYWSSCPAGSISGQEATDVAGFVSYSPGVAYTLTSTAGPLDNINLVINAVVPQSGNMRVSFSGLLASTGANVVFGGFFINGVGVSTLQELCQVAFTGRVAFDGIIQGQTPGSTVGLEIGVWALTGTPTFSGNITGFVQAL